MDITVTFPRGRQALASIGEHTILTDQPKEQGGDDAAPGPFDLFLASLATCTGYYVLAFCQARGLATDGLRVVQRVDVDPATHLPRRVDIDVLLPPSFPEKYRAAVVRAAEGCKVKKTLAAPPQVAVRAVAEEEASAVRVAEVAAAS